MQLLVANNATSALAIGIGPADTACSLQAGTGELFPDPAPGQYFAATIVAAASGLVREIVYVTARTGDGVVAMLRGQEGTAAGTWLAGDLFWCEFTAGAARAFAQMPAFAGLDPNGSVPGVAASDFGAASMVVATANGSVWYCSQTGGAGSAIWTPITGDFRLRVTATVLDVYVATTGNDSNTGLSPGSPFQTWQRAWDYLVSSVDLNGHNAVVHIANGAYNEALYASGTILGQGDASTVRFEGNISNASLVTLTSTGGPNTITARGAQLSVMGVTIANVDPDLTKPDTQGAGIAAEYGASVWFNALVFGFCPSYHLAAANGASILAGHPDPGSGGAVYSIIGGALGHMHAVNGADINVSGASVVVMTNPTFVYGFAIAFACATIEAIGNTYIGTAVGSRYSSTYNAVIITAGAPDDYFPGSLVGTVGFGGQVS